MALLALTKKHQPDRMDGGSVILAEAHTTVAATDHASSKGYVLRTLEVRNGAAEQVIFTVEGGFKRADGTLHWYTLATRDHGSDTFVTTAITTLAGVSQILEISPTPIVDFIRVNVSESNGTNGTFFALHLEV